uniref:Testicular haploid expressed gene protein-like n=1 Tax=Glossina brevipalpis TaxID=37001 RepID=A0A1A9W3T4_9MUSC
MWLKEAQAECCEIVEPLVSHAECFVPDVCEELSQLQCLHDQQFIRRRRIWELAKPTRRVPRFTPLCPCKLKKPIEIVHLEKRGHTRTEQLAYPTVRRLMLFKKDVANLFDPYRLVNLNRVIRKSLLSVYSRLANIQPPQEKKKITKWDKTDWAKHTIILVKLAKPKKTFEEKKPPSPSMPLKKMKRYKSLALPKKHEELEKPVWILTISMSRYKASERTKTLAKPTERDASQLHRELPVEIPRGALKHKASKRTVELSEPRRTAKAAPSDLKENPFVVSPNALKYKASKRTKELAEAREYENKHIREDPFAISPAALKAKAKPRIIELAKPKGSA